MSDVQHAQPDPPDDEHGNVPEWYHPLRPPFEEGNTAALTHGAWSPAVVEPKALEILEAVRPTVTWWTAADEPAVQSWARTEARVQLIHAWLVERGSELDADGEPLGAANMLTRLEKQAESLRNRLGLDPLSRARLGRDVAATQVDLAALMAEEVQRQAMEAAGREATAGEVGGGPDDADR